MKQHSLSENTQKLYTHYLKAHKGKTINQEWINKRYRKGKVSSAEQALLKHINETFNLSLNFYKRKGRPRSTEIDYFTQAEIAKLYQVTAKDKKLNLNIRLMYECGLRVSEAMNLKKKYFDWVNKRIKGVGKGNKEYDLPVMEETASLLHNYFAFFSPEDKPLEYDGAALPREKFYRELKRVCALHLPHKEESTVYPHALRHTTGMHMSLAGFDVLEIQLFLRHASIQTTQRYAKANRMSVENKWKKALGGAL
jgi:integrase